MPKSAPANTTERRIVGSVITGAKIYKPGDEEKLASAMTGRSFARLLEKGVVTGDWTTAPATPAAPEGEASDAADGTERSEASETPSTDSSASSETSEASPPKPRSKAAATKRARE